MLKLTRVVEDRNRSFVIAVLDFVDYLGRVYGLLLVFFVRRKQALFRNGDLETVEVRHYRILLWQI